MHSRNMACSDIALISNIFMLIYILFSAIVAAATSPSKILPRKSLPFHENLKLDGLNGFSAPLIHPNNPESPFYDPNATPEEVHEASIRSSRARGEYLHMIMSSGSGAGSFYGSRKDPISNVTYTDRNFVMRFSIGEPSFKTYAIPDTGSSLIWIQCLPCTSCFPQTPPIYDPAKSIGNAKVSCREESCQEALGEDSHTCDAPDYNCTFNMGYEDGSSSKGEIWKDTLIFDDDHGFFTRYYYMNNALFGCGHVNPLHVGAIPPFPPGVVGLNNGTGSLLRQLGWYMLSFCVSADAETFQSDHKSRIYFGPAAQLNPRFITHLVNNPGGWYIFKNFKGIWVGQNQVKGYPEWVFQYKEGGEGGLLVDTGTTYTMLYDLVVDAIVEEIKDNVELAPQVDRSNNNWSLCYSTDSLNPLLLPEISFRFTDTDYNLPYRWTNFWMYNQARQTCLAIDKVKHISVIGMHQLRDVRVGIDTSKDKITFGERFNC